MGAFIAKVPKTCESEVDIFIPTYLLTYLDLPTYQTNNDSEIRNKLGRFCETISENNFMNSLGEFITAQKLEMQNLKESMPVIIYCVRHFLDKYSKRIGTFTIRIYVQIQHFKITV